MFFKFRKCIKHLIYAVLSLFCFCFFVPFVSARSKTENWWTNIDSQFIDFFIFSCNSSSGHGCSGSSSPQVGTSIFTFPYSANSSDTQDFGKNGIFSNSISGYADLSFVGFTGDRMKKGNAYSIQFYMCTNFGFTGDREKMKFVLNGSSSTAYDSLDSTSRYSYQNTNISYLSDMPSSNTPTGSYTDCVMASSIVVPTDDLQWFNWELYNKGINFTDARFYIFGLSINDLGISSNEIENIVNNSGFATASSVEEVKTATAEIKEEAKKTNDTISNSDISDSNSQTSAFFDDFDSGDTGSLMNIVKLPLKFLDSLNSQCSSITINTGYLGNITIPCLSSSLYSVDGLKQIITIATLVLNASICYGCIKSIVSCVEKLKNPNDDEIEVIDL